MNCFSVPRIYSVCLVKTTTATEEQNTKRLTYKIIIISKVLRFVMTSPVSAVPWLK